jgi:uncharacterized membrane protein YebE (DUF533 family)
MSAEIKTLIVKMKNEIDNAKDAISNSERIMATMYAMAAAEDGKIDDKEKEAMK